jgi:hypothetical protein
MLIASWCRAKKFLFNDTPNHNAARELTVSKPGCEAMAI